MGGCGRFSSFLHAIIPWLVPSILVLLWEWISRHYPDTAELFPGPSSILVAASNLLETGELVAHVRVSAIRALTGLVIGGGLGFVLGILTGLSRTAEVVLDTSIQMVRTIPHLALVPLIIIWLGIGEVTRISLVALGAFFPIYINTYHGVRTVDPQLLEMARVYGLGRWAMFKDVLVPGALPSILLGFRYALGVVWLSLIVAETIATTSGIGYLATNAREFLQTDIVIVAILVYALLGKAADVMARFLESRLLRWNSAYQTKGVR